MWAPEYASDVALASWLGIEDLLGDLEINVAITRAVNTASRSIDRACNRQFGILAAVEASYYTAERDRATGLYLVAIDDLMDTAGLIVAGDTSHDLSFATTYTDYRLLPFNAALKGRPYEGLVFPVGTSLPTEEGAIRVTARFGWTAIPATIEQAAIIQSARFFQRRNAPFGISGSPEMQGELRLLDRLDPDVALMVRDYRRTWAAA